MVPSVKFNDEGTVYELHSFIHEIPSTSHRCFVRYLFSDIAKMFWLRKQNYITYHSFVSYIYFNNLFNISTTQLHYEYA